MKDVYLIDAKRSAIGKFLGSFYENDPKKVSSDVIKDLIKDLNVNDINLTIVGNVISANLGQSFFRKIAIDAGIPLEKPSYAVNMVCGSRMLAIINACKEINCGMNLIVAGGFEFMSNIPYATDTYLRYGKKFGDFSMVDLMVSDGLTDAFSGQHMGITAENIAKKYGISRKEQDEYSWNTLQKAIQSIDSGVFKDEIVPVDVIDYKGNICRFDTDEFANRTSTFEKIERLKPTFVKDGTGTITPASSSGINDGCAFATIASEDYIKNNSIKPLSIIKGYSYVGCDPQYMGLGPYYAIKKLINECKININDIDVFEINEAFAAQVIASVRLLAKEFNIKEKAIFDKLNINGSGIGLGHPLGASGARIITTLAHTMKRNNYKYGIASLCVGGGQGVAILLENAK